MPGSGPLPWNQRQQRPRIGQVCPFSQHILRAAAARVQCRGGHQSGFDQIAVDIAQNGHEIVIILHRLASVPAFKQTAVPLITTVVAVDVPSAQPAHYLADGLFIPTLPQQQVQVVWHQAPGIQSESALSLVLPQPFQKSLVIPLVLEDPLLVASA